MSSVIISVYIVTKASDILFRHNYRNDIKVNPERFLSHVESVKEVEPILVIGEESWYCICASGLYWVAAVKQQYNSILTLQWLLNWHKLCEELCGSLSPRTISENILLIAETAIEIAEQGYIQLMNNDNLKMLLQSDSRKTSNLSVLIDLVEHLNVLVEADGNIQKCHIQGKLTLTSSLRSTKPLTLYLNHPVKVGKQEEYGNIVWVEDCSFDQPSYKTELEENGSLNVIPTQDGNTIITYLLQEPPPQHLPVTGSAVLKVLSSGDIEVNIELEFKGEVLWLEAEFPISASVKRVCHLTNGWTVDSQTSCLKLLQKPAPPTLTFTATLVGGNTDMKEYGPLLLRFEISQFLLSGLKVKKVVLPSEMTAGNSINKWVRHVTLVESFIINVATVKT